MSFCIYFFLSYHSIAYLTEWFLLHISIISVLAYPLALVILDKFSLLLGCSKEKKVKEEITLRWKKLYIFLIVHFCGHAKHLTELWVTHFITKVQLIRAVPPVLIGEWLSGCRHANTCICPTAMCFCMYVPVSAMHKAGEFPNFNSRFTFGCAFWAAIGGLPFGVWQTWKRYIHHNPNSIQISSSMWA